MVMCRFDRSALIAKGAAALMLAICAAVPVVSVAQDSAGASRKADRAGAQAAPGRTPSPVSPPSTPGPGKVPAPSSAQSPAAQPPASPSTAGPGKALGELFGRAGAVSCAPRIEQVGDFLLQGGEAGVFLFLPESAPDQRQIGLSLEIASPVGGPGSNSASGSPSAYASADFSPSVDGTCGASYQAIAYWPGSCAEVAKTRFPTNKSLGVVKRSILMLELSKLGRIFLMPAGAGCVSIKRELLP
jgi:hypothetical protein